MGSVPNCQKEIPVHHAIRWFKCKLKPPKNENKNERCKERKDEGIESESNEDSSDGRGVKKGD